MVEFAINRKSIVKKLKRVKKLENKRVKKLKNKKVKG